jgi:Protein of unknown function (DUF3014)
MKRALPWIAVAVALILAGGWYWWRQSVSPPPVTPAPQAQAPAPPPPQAEAPPEPPKHPIEQARPDQPAREPAPGFAESNQLIRDTLLGALGSDAVISFFNVDDYIRRTVATVDNLPRQRAAPRLWPVVPMAGSPAVTGTDTAATLDAKNAERYARFISLVQRMDTGKFVALYVRLYPHFQQAYADLGFPSRHFNDRLVEVIDHLLAAPDVQGPIALKKPWILWEYADPKLESLSAGQKIMVRVGPENAAKLKAKLRDIRRQVAAADVKG